MKNRKYRIQDLESSDRPRERLAQLGASALSAPELVAVLLGSGFRGRNAIEVGQDLLSDYGGWAGLQRAGYRDLCRRRGIGPAKAANLKAATEIGRRMSISGEDERAVIQSPEDAARLVLYDMGALEQETLRVMLLDTRNHLVAIQEVYRGSVNSSLVRVGELFREAVRSNVPSIIVAHNHPSGDPTPSAEDISVTRALIEAGRLLDIEVLDHLVIGKGRFVSMKSRGLGFEG